MGLEFSPITPVGVAKQIKFNYSTALLNGAVRAIISRFANDRLQADKTRLAKTS